MKCGHFLPQGEEIQCEFFCDMYGCIECISVVRYSCCGWQVRACQQHSTLKKECGKCGLCVECGLKRRNSQMYQCKGCKEALCPGCNGDRHFLCSACKTQQGYVKLDCCNEWIPPTNKIHYELSTTNACWCGSFHELSSQQIHCYVQDCHTRTIRCCAHKKMDNPGLKCVECKRITCMYHVVICMSCGARNCDDCFDSHQTHLSYRVCKTCVKEQDKILQSIISVEPLVSLIQSYLR
jgi:hypothetical protein